MPTYCFTKVTTTNTVLLRHKSEEWETNSKTFFRYLRLGSSRDQISRYALLSIHEYKRIIIGDIDNFTLYYRWDNLHEYIIVVINSRLFALYHCK